MEIEKGYYNDGQIRFWWPVENVQPHGICKGWHENGQLHYECSFQHGKEHGVEKRWNEFGELTCIKYYLYDEEVSEEEYRKHELITQLAGVKDES